MSKSPCAPLLFASLGRLVGVPIATRDGPHASSDIVVDIVGEVCQRYAQRPFGRIKAATIEQHDAMRLGQTEREVERMNVLFQIVDGLVANVLPRPELEIDQT